jgi:phenylacetate-CoA ligase
VNAARATQALGHLRQAGGRWLVENAFRDAWALHQNTEWCPQEIVRDRQWEWTRALLQDVYNGNLFYKRRLDEAGWPALDREAFNCVRTTSQNEIAIHAAKIGSQRGAEVRRSSGGSAGSRVAIPLDRETYGWYMAGTWRGFGWWGVGPADPVVLLLGHRAGNWRTTLTARAKDWLVNWRRIPVGDRFDAEAVEIAHRIECYAPAILYGYPSAVHRVAGVLRDKGWRPRGRLRVIVLTGEPVYAFQRKAIQEAFGCPVAEEYGCGELGCMAFECPHGTLHATVENVFLQIVRPSNGWSGEEGLILATQLRNKMFPLIRYETGDLGIFKTRQCPCGRGLPALQVCGRASDHLIASGSGAAIPARTKLEPFFSLLPERLQGRVRVAHRTIGTVHLEVERGSASSAELARVVDVGKDVFHPDWHVRVVTVERFPRIMSGKLPYFLPLRDGLNSPPEDGAIIKTPGSALTPPI